MIYQHLIVVSLEFQTIVHKQRLKASPTSLVFERNAVGALVPSLQRPAVSSARLAAHVEVSLYGPGPLPQGAVALKEHRVLVNVTHGVQLPRRAGRRVKQPL